MVRGLYTSAMGMITHMQRMDVITNNLSHVDTTGYKRDHVVSHAFSNEVMRRLNDPGLRLFRDWPIGIVNPGVFVDTMFTDFSQGALRSTGNDLDLAISGQGFFVVNVNGEELFTRDGSFTIFDGILMTADGGRVQGLNGDITLPSGLVTIGSNAQLYVNGEYIDTLRLTNFTDLNSLRKLQNNFFRTTEESEILGFDGQVLQGYLEASNVNSVREMVQIITLSRAYETNSRMITIQDQTLQQAVNNIARR
jgi:flagellar basal-body rod protein FlgG